VPAPTGFLPQVSTTHGRRVRELIARDQRAAIEPGRRLLVRHGIAVLEATPTIPLDQLLHGRPRARIGAA
jgi:hypothetical protein